MVVKRCCMVRLVDKVIILCLIQTFANTLLGFRVALLLYLMFCNSTHRVDVQGNMLLPYYRNKIVALFSRP